jgi:hypothetical protein
MKKCNCCEKKKPLDAFANLKSAKDGKSYQCKSCIETIVLICTNKKLTEEELNAKIRKQGRALWISVAVRQGKSNKEIIARADNIKSGNARGMFL